ncbi:hypothetical protein Y032_0125g1268 [Ancylostoma ceylanicum]|uniref:Glycogen debranching enzyme C-terminal domain-containing protein n=1 Tax=Ancylostoma ceylanicum TaxID=53326 RepID=A0A016T8S7_9BILA|nr:hypothetical protein Y032_0125g1268 [Ancylostoma ceylanicum]
MDCPVFYIRNQESDMGPPDSPDFALSGVSALTSIEWLWVAGFYLRARLAVGHALGGSHWASAKKEVQSRLGNYYGHIKKSTWSSLPELTNSNGSTCWGSCPAQAWSVGCILEACLDFVDLASAMN